MVTEKKTTRRRMIKKSNCNTSQNPKENILLTNIPTGERDFYMKLSY
jgi:hypothetical protein